MDYIIKKTDTVTNGQFTIKPYTTNGPASPASSVPLDAHATSANTSLILLGKGMYDYGELIAADFVHLLENFSGPTAPVYPIQGQLWYKNATKELFIYDGTFTGQKVIIDGLLTSNLNVNTHRIVNVSDPIDPTDAVTLQYLTTNYMTFAGGTMFLNANITFNGGEVLGLPATPSGNTAATSKLYVDTLDTATRSWASGLFLLKSGDTMSGNLTMSADTHIYLPTPTGGFALAGEVVNKGYVDTLLSGTTAFVHITGDTMTGPLVINGSTSYSGPSPLTVTAVAVSPTNTITVSGGDYTASFTSGAKFNATLDATAGYQVVDVGGAKIGTDPTGLTNDVPATAGYATIAFTATPLVTPTTAIAIAGGLYDFTIAIDGGIATVYTVTATGTDTMTTMAALMSAALTGATVAAVGDAFVITSATTGLTSTIAVTEPAGGANTDLFSAIDTALTATHTTVSTGGADAIVTTYTASIDVDGVAHPISITGGSAQTYANLIIEINNDLGFVGSSALVGGNIQVTSATTGITSTVAITDTNLFATLTGYVGILPAVVGIDAVTGIFTVVIATYSAPDTVVQVSETLTIPSTSGTVTAIPTLQVLNGLTQLAGDFRISGAGRTIFMDGNIIQSVGYPLVADDAATKGYVDAEIITATTGLADGTLSTATFTGNTLTLNSTVGSPVTVSGIANAVHEHLSTEVRQNVIVDNGTNSLLRSIFAVSSSTYPSVSVQDTIATIDNYLYQLLLPASRTIYTAAYDTVITFSAPTLANLPIIGFTTGLNGTYVIAGDYTTTFKVDVMFTIAGDTGHPANTIQYVQTAVFAAGNTTITVRGTVPADTVGDGHILQSYGAVEVSGRAHLRFAQSSTLNLSGNTGGSNGDYTLLAVSHDVADTKTYLYAASTTPFPGTTTPDGSILPYEILTTDRFIVESNKLHVYRHGIKLYNSTRGCMRATIPVFSDKIFDWYPTGLSAGVYTFTTAIDGGAPVAIIITVSYTLDTIIGVDTINNTWTISGAPANIYNQFTRFDVVSNVGLGVTTAYSVKSVETVGGNTVIHTNENISPSADISGSIRLPYTFQMLTSAIQTAFAGAFVTVPTVQIQNNALYFYSPTPGTGSSISIVDGTLFSALSASTVIDLISTGVSYGYNELGAPFGLSRFVRLPSLPTIGDVYEVINMQ